MFSYGPLHMAEQKQSNKLEPSSSVRIRDVALRTCQKQRTIGRSGERGSGISVLAAQDDDDNFNRKLYEILQFTSSLKYFNQCFENIYKKKIDAKRSSSLI